jgi:hypothetical protein
LLIALPEDSGVFDGQGKIQKKIPYQMDIIWQAIQITMPWFGLRPYKIGNIFNFLQVYQLMSHWEF